MLAAVIASPMRLAAAVERRLSANAEYVASLWDKPAPQPAASEGGRRVSFDASAEKPAVKRVEKRTRAGVEPRIKQEAERDQPFRSKRQKVKAGFYSESNLASLAWRGEGTSKDPIQL